MHQAAENGTRLGHRQLTPPRQADIIGRDDGIAMTTWPDEERELLAEVARAAELADPVPSEVLEAARASLTWLRVDAELAELLADSASASRAVRSEEGSRLVSFAAGDVAIDLEVIAAGDTRRLVGQMSPAGAVDIEIRHAVSGSATQIPIDDLGRFTAERVPPGLISLVSTPPGAAVPIATTWIRI
jgi:hypothetical protein